MSFIKTHHIKLILWIIQLFNYIRISNSLNISYYEEFFYAGAHDYLEDSGLSVIEWADIVADALPGDALLVQLEYADGDKRRITVI